MEAFSSPPPSVAPCTDTLQDGGVPRKKRKAAEKEPTDGEREEDHGEGEKESGEKQADEEAGEAAREGGGAEEHGEKESNEDSSVEKELVTQLDGKENARSSKQSDVGQEEEAGRKKEDKSDEELEELASEEESSSARAPAAEEGRTEAEEESSSENEPTKWRGSELNPGRSGVSSFSHESETDASSSGEE